MGEGRGASCPLAERHARAHGELPIGSALLALGAASSNGATTMLFGAMPTPLTLWVLNSNYPQTRKSELTKLLSEGGAVLNGLIREKVTDHAGSLASGRVGYMRSPFQSVDEPMALPHAHAG